MTARRFLALGDSYTIGEQVRLEARWPVQLARALRGRGVPVDDPLIVAKTGWTTDELAAGIAEARPSGEYALVSLLIGVNDQYRGRSGDDYGPRFRALLDSAVALAGGHPARAVVLSIPDWGVTPFAEGRDRGRIGAEIDAFNAIARDEATRAGAHWVDVTPTSRMPRPGWLASDGLHPSRDQYAAWTELVLPVAEVVLAGG